MGVKTSSVLQIQTNVCFQPMISRLTDIGVGSILDYAVEEDIDHEEAVSLEMDSCIGEDLSQEGINAVNISKKTIKIFIPCDFFYFPGQPEIQLKGVHLTWKDFLITLDHTNTAK